MPGDKIKATESDRRPQGEAHTRMNMRDRLKRLFHKQGTKRDPKLDDVLDSKSGWSNSTLVDPQIHGGSSGQNGRNHRRQASRPHYRNPGGRSLNARALAVTARRARPGSRYVITIVPSVASRTNIF